jgi:uncharacterized protein
MLERLFIRDREVREDLVRIASRIRTSTRLLQELFEAPADGDAIVLSIGGEERAARLAARELDVRMSRGLLALLDRDDVHMLSRRLERVIRLVQDTAERARTFHIERSAPAARQLCGALVGTGEDLAFAVAHISMDERVVLARCAAVTAREEEENRLHSSGVGALFDRPPDPLDVLKWKELYEMLVEALAACRQAARTLERVARKSM